MVAFALIHKAKSYIIVPTDFWQLKRINCFIFFWIFISQPGWGLLEVFLQQQTTDWRLLRKIEPLDALVRSQFAFTRTHVHTHTYTRARSNMQTQKQVGQETSQLVRSGGRGEPALFTGLLLIDKNHTWSSSLLAEQVNRFCPMSDTHRRRIVWPRLLKPLRCGLSQEATDQVQSVGRRWRSWCSSQEEEALSQSRGVWSSKVSFSPVETQEALCLRL